MSREATSFFVGLTLLALTGRSSAEEYRDAARHFTITLPGGWGQIPAEALARVNQQVKARMEAVQYATGFQEVKRLPLSFPYVLVQIQAAPPPGTSYEQIERELGAKLQAGVRKAEGSLADVLKNVSVGSAALDRTKNRIYMNMQMEVAGVGKVRSLSVGALGSEHVVFIHCYAPENEIEERSPVFNQIVDSFTFEPGYEFKPDSGSGFDSSRIAVMAAAGALIGLAVALINKLRKGKRTPDPDMPNSQLIR
jgi:hypothetical protein